jgi:tripartite ATP-independent transporter DctP family solute receptor
MTRRAAAMSGLAGLMLAGCDRSGGRVLLSSDTHPSGYPTVEAVQEMGRLLSERTEGRLGVRVYAGGQLGAERDTLEITTFGGLDMNRVFMSPLNAIEPDTMIPSLPFLFHSKDHMRRALDGAPGREILDTLEKHGLIGLCYYDSGERSFYNTRRAIYTPDDMKGMKIRTPSAAQSSQLEALGAVPIDMPANQIYNSLDRGVVDAAMIPISGAIDFKLIEVARYFTLNAPLGRSPFLVAMNQARYDKLGPEEKKAIDNTTGLGLSLKGTETYEARGRMAVDQIKKDRELIMLSDAEHKRWMDAFKPLIASKVAEAQKAGIDAKGLLGAYGVSV